jgi:xanthine phosphoribosyltransferase
MEKALHVSWDQFHRDTKVLARRLSTAGPFFGLVAVTRGGLVPAAIIARELDLRLIDTFCVTSYRNEKIRGDAQILKGVSAALTDRDGTASSSSTISSIRARP